MLANLYGVRLLFTPAGRRAAIIVVLAALVLFRALQFVDMAQDPFWAADFNAYWTAAKHVLGGEPIYASFQLAGMYVPEGRVAYLYPPPFAVLMTPIAWLVPADHRVAAWIWVGIGAACLLGSVVAVARSDGLASRLSGRLAGTLGLSDGAVVATLVVLAFVFTPVLGEITVGNVHLQLVALLSVAWLGIRRGDAIGEAVGGAAIGVAALIKVFPGLLIVWLVARGQFRAAGWALGAMGALALATLPVVGVQGWLDFIRSLLNMGMLEAVIDSVSPTMWLAPFLGFDIARYAVLTAGVLAVVWAARRRDARTGFALATTISVLVSPSVFHHYLAVLVLPLLLAPSAGVSLRLVLASYLLMYGGQQPALGEWSWILSRVPQTLGWALLLMGLARAHGVDADVQDPVDAGRSRADGGLHPARPSAGAVASS